MSINTHTDMYIYSLGVCAEQTPCSPRHPCFSCRVGASRTLNHFQRVHLHRPPQEIRFCSPFCKPPCNKIIGFQRLLCIPHFKLLSEETIPISFSRFFSSIFFPAEAAPGVRTPSISPPAGKPLSLKPKRDTSMALIV